MKEALIEHRQSVLRAHGERRRVRWAVGASSPAARQPPSNGGISHEDGRLGGYGKGCDEHRHAGSIRLDLADQDVAISAAIEVGGEDFLGREQQLSAPRSSTSHLPQARYIHIRGVKRGGAGSCINVPEARKQELT